MKRLFTLLLGVVSLQSIAQTSPTSADIYAGLRKLNVLGSVLYIAAHPDDENTRLLTYFSKDRLYRTGYLSLTRGDGGQNLIGDEQGVDLGLIRTQELLAARKIDGAEQFFTRAYDFGFSKNPEETFTKWDKDKILSDVVWVIRQFQPDVIITRFPTTGEGGHGHHTASAILANEAFTAAADPKRFPEQLKWVQPWQAKRILWNTFNFGSGNTQSEDQFKFDVGGFNPIIGKSYGEIAAESRSQHKSQGFGAARTRGEAMEYFKPTGGTAVSTDLFEDVTTSWQRIKGGGGVQQIVQSALASFDFMQPQKSIPQLIQVYKALEKLPASYWRSQKLKETQQLIVDASGLWLETVTNTQFAVQNDSLRFTTTLNNRLGSTVELTSLTVNAFDTVLNSELSKNKNVVINKTMFIPASIKVTQPYWLRDKMQEGYFTVNEQELIGKPDIEPAFTATYNLVIDGLPLAITKPVRYKYTDPVKGELYQPVTVVPAVSIHTQPPLVLFKKGEEESKQVTVEVGANKNIQYKSANILLRTSTDAINIKDGSAAIAKGTARPVDVSIKPTVVPASSEEDFALPFVTLDNDTSSYYLGLSTIRYDHIPNISRFYTDAIKLVKLDLKTKGKRIGYIVGAGDHVPEALEEMGYEVVLLTNKELARNNLKQYDAIIAGVRAYNTNDWLNKHYDKLMKYVEEGGNLIAQYNTSNQIGPVRAKIGPYNFNISRNRITDENAVVNFVNPGHQVLNFPNKITSKDFNGWVQERSIYHATDVDKNFETVISMSDPGEQADANSLIIAKYGKGYFTYTGLVFFRQLPAGVPGAYRLLANLIALNQKKEI
ncbi:PIG-L family deacetylase [Flavisolibacter tropicus]|uniref:LmbE family protein n=1 Tax=Flavisolibacter tropicus TaxID=1492898 RepID=A0A172U0K0_9BACT|nr:PIG-L family deacetylase [Flavisolibacter tropicus]ANE52889.1 hypothetical protein SY85_22805 [Flavisolibacter tropicus]